MTETPSIRDEIIGVVTHVAEPVSETPAVARRRRIVVVAVIVVGAALLSFSLSRKPGDPSFYWLTFGLAAVWAGGALLSGPLRYGSVPWQGRRRRPVLTGTLIGLAVGGAFVVGGLVARQIPPVAEFITRVLEFAHQGSLPLIVVITLVNGVAEEMFFRGAVYPALGKYHPVIVSTVVYAIATSAGGNPMLGFAAVILGGVCALERRATGGVLAPVLTHLVWGLIMVLALPPVFGL
ncbi:CPBP family intramembrane glutamic endopeptidase [Mycolicibacterium komossense]|uniref:CPBP family intramembrane metalloprotease n=1 Tax=Mycolicibacterium komossense TaxID=1779 RepID=A0ABT3C4T2_9MYCO|nr:CPBP family intramembrane glutamic endopeptidase [Mycolicibacterium komossense]MCV7224489.1 CPBP family intramembrane metalloprotease [Mycolicibacterium komossense]